MSQPELKNEWGFYRVGTTHLLTSHFVFIVSRAEDIYQSLPAARRTSGTDLPESHRVLSQFVLQKKRLET